MNQFASNYKDIEQLVADLSAAVLDLVDDGKLMPVVLIDGRAGSGKSTLADALQRALFKAGDSLPRLVHMDDLYPGWDGLSAGADYLQRFILTPLMKRETASWQQFDWVKNERNEWREFSGGTPLIVEGCGSLNSQSSPIADFKVWLDVPQKTRFERWIDREGTDAHWAKWSAQEADFYDREKSEELATTLFTGI